MKLIVEEVEEVKQTIDKDKKEVFIEGIYAQTIKNHNGRIYPKPVLERVIREYKRDFIDKNMALGELNHPTTLAINPKEVCLKTIDAKWISEENVWGKSKLTNTPNGRLVANLVIDDGVQLGVSTRGSGSVKYLSEGTVVQNDYFLKCWDVVTDPSAPEAFVNGIMENREWIFVDGVLVEQEIESIKKEVNHQMSRIQTFDKKAFQEIFDKIYDNVIHKS